MIHCAVCVELLLLSDYPRGPSLAGISSNIRTEIWNMEYIQIIFPYMYVYFRILFLSRDIKLHHLIICGGRQLYQTSCSQSSLILKVIPLLDGSRKVAVALLVSSCFGWRGYTYIRLGQLSY